MDDGKVIDEIKTGEGVARMAASATVCEDREKSYELILGARADELLARHGATVEGCVVSGMASSRMGWRELPYAALPQPISGANLTTARLQAPLTDGAPLNVLLVSGIQSSEDVMRGEEVELLGLAQQLPALAEAASALLIMPGTHSKHVRLSRGVITGFDTFMTGELYAHLLHTPTLAASLHPDASFDENDPWFVRGLAEAASEGLLKSLFKIRSRNLLQGVQPVEGTAFLSGLLIGSEVLHAREAAPCVYLAAGGKLAQLYGKAIGDLEIQNAELIDSAVVERAAIDGHLRLLHSTLLSAR